MNGIRDFFSDNTWQEARTRTSSTKFVFFGPLEKNKIATLSSDWLRHLWLLFWNRWTEFDNTHQEARTQHPLTSLCFLGRLEKRDGRSSLWLAGTFSTIPLKLRYGVWWNLTGSKILTAYTKFMFFRPIWKTRWMSLLLICWDIFYFFSALW